MIKIRLARLKSKDVAYRIVAIDSKRKREGKPISIIGFYQPSKKIKRIDEEKLRYFLNLGAVVNESLKKILNNEKAT